MNYNKLDPILEPIMTAVRVAERFLGPQDDWVEDDRRIVYEAAQRHLSHLHRFTNEKGTADYFTTADASSDRVEEALSAAGYQRNLASTRKYREHHDGGRQWAVGSWVHDPSDTETQHHVYLFELGEQTDIYGHFETSVREGAEHLTDTDQIHGDPYGRTRDALDVAGITHDERQL